LYAGMIFYISSRTPSDVKFFLILPDYLLHFIEYGILMWLVMRLVNNVSIISAKTCIWAFTAVILFAVSDEFHQSFIPGRDAGIADILADAAGALAAMGIYVYSKRLKRKREAKKTKNSN